MTRRTALLIPVIAAVWLWALAGCMTPTASAAVQTQPAAAAQDHSWPPPLPGADSATGTATIETPDLLLVPEDVSKMLDQPGMAPFVVAKTAPSIDFTTHRDLPDLALNGTGWSSWGDICLASDGKVYVGIGDHGDDAGGKAHVFIYCYDPARKVLKQIIDPNQFPPREPGEVTFSKVHAGIQESKQGRIYVICTLNDGQQAGKIKWNERIPGAQLIEYDPKTGKARVVGAIPGLCTATTLMDRERDLLYLCLEGHPPTSGLGAFDVFSGKLVLQTPFDVITANRNIAMDGDGNVYFNGKGDRIWKCDARTHELTPTNSTFAVEGKEKPTMRSSTRASKAGFIYGSTMGPGRLFRYHAATDKLEVLGPDFLDGRYTTVTVLSPDEKFVYYLPGAHGDAKDMGTPVLQYNVATGERKVLAFLKAPVERLSGVVVSGTYGVKISAEGSTLYVNFNGHARDDIRPKGMTAGGFGYTSFAAIHIPASER